MENNIRVRSHIFNQLMKDEENRKTWEMLCSTDKPLVPFIGAGISSWCYPMWDDLLQKVVRKNFSEACSKIVAEALQGCKNSKYKPTVRQGENEPFRWMEEIAEYIFDDNESTFSQNKDMFKPRKQAGGDVSEEQKKANETLENLHRHLGGYGINARRAAVKSLYKAFDIERLKKKEGFPEYQNFFPRLFSDLLVTTNYDKALERCYPSIFSYSYSDLKAENENEESWLYQAVEEKLNQMQARLQGTDWAAGIAVPDIPMLLKVHGSIEQASNIALSRERYKSVYKGEMPELFGLICQRSSLIFMGCGLREDRILDELKAQKHRVEEEADHSFRHFAFYPEPESDEEKKELRQRLDGYGIYPIFYSKSALSGSLLDGGDDYHSDCLGILLENLLRRKMHYHQPLELLWDDKRFAPLEISGGIKSAARIQSINKDAQYDAQYVHVEEASQIWELLKSSAECPLIAVTGDTGSGKSTFCQNIQKLNKNPRDAMQFFYVSLEDCKTWNEFCIQIYENLNIVPSGIEEMSRWWEVAERVERRCNGYWRSVLIFDHLDELEDETTYPGQWETIKEMLKYWKRHQIRIIFTMRKYPQGISCYTWRIGALTAQEATMVFFSACISRRYGNSSMVEQNTLDGLFSKPIFQPASAYLLGRYADSKNDLATLLEEWESCKKRGDSGEQTLARLMWNHLLDEHQWADKDDSEKRDIEKNILWIWGILGTYPGIFPKAFFGCTWLPTGHSYQNRELSQKTLIYMKNAGLCEEMMDEKYGFLLENMIQCVNQFSKRLKTEGGKYESFDFLEEVSLDGLMNFRGYAMDKYDGDLRKYALEEWIKKRGEEGEEWNPEQLDAENDVLNILEMLGKQVESDEGRKLHKNLNLVLHYEIKTVIRFLFTQMSHNTNNNEHRIKIAKIGYYFAHYYHYIPSHAFPMVQRLINVAEESAGSPKEGKAEFAHYMRANLYKVMGDVHKLLGQKESAVECYKKARGLCDEQMLQSFTDGDDSEQYREGKRTKASVLLLSDYCGFTDSNETNEEAKDLYGQIGDEWGNAYYNQRKGESIYEEGPESNSESEADFFAKVCDYYNAAAEHYGKVEDMTGIAYILKCMGDLIGQCRAVYKNDKAPYRLWKVKKGGAVYYKILSEKADLPDGEEIEGSLADWTYAGAHCYAQAFTTYCRHINWRGFANVLQGMGNLLRYRLIEKKETGKITPDPEDYEAIETIFGFAEECFRWLGDMRGLADTLDYSGHGYKEKGGDIAAYIALGKWMESEELWRGQKNYKKVSNTQRELKNLRARVNGVIDERQEDEAEEAAEQEDVK